MQPARAARPWLLLLPALLSVTLLFAGGLGLALVQSLGYMPIIGQTEFSLTAYADIFRQPAFRRSLLLTLWIAGASTALSTVLAVACALALRGRFRGRRWVMFLFQLNIPIPHLVGAIGILLLVSQSGLLARLSYAAGWISQPAEFPPLVYDRYAVGIILEYVWKTTCFTGIVTVAALQSLGDRYDQVARTLGASAWQRLRYVTLPLLMPSVLSASVLVFAFTFGAFEIPFLLGQTFPAALPVLAYRRYVDVDLALRPEAMAMSMVIAALSTLLIFGYMTVARRQGR